VDLDEYVRRRRPALFRFAVVLAGDPVLAEDVLADALARATEHWPQVSAADNVHAYVRKMVLNEYLGWRRRAARVAVRSDIGDLLAPAADHAEAHAEHAQLAAELRRLPPKQRAAVVLRFYEGLSYAEVARLLGGRESTARSTVHRALATLRIELSDDASPSDAPSPTAVTEVPR
jgi:RNA polymerase sigma-70 factor (sigma-E family)